MLKYCLSGTFFHYPVCPTQNLSEKKYGTVKSHAFNVTFRSVDVNQITCNAILFILHSQYESSLVIVHNKPIKMELSLITPPPAHTSTHTHFLLFFLYQIVWFSGYKYTRMLVMYKTKKVQFVHEILSDIFSVNKIIFRIPLFARFNKAKNYVCQGMVL